MHIVNCYNKNNDYYIDFRQLLEEDEFLEYGEKLGNMGITFTDMAKAPSSVNEIISRTVHNYIINPDDLKYLIIDKTVILDATSDNFIRLKNAIKEYAEHFENMIIIEQGGDPVGEFKREAGNGRNFYLFTESDRNKLIREVLDKIIELEKNPKENEKSSREKVFNEPITKTEAVVESKNKGRIKEKIVRKLRERGEKQEKNENAAKEVQNPKIEGSSFKEDKDTEKEIELPKASYMTKTALVTNEPKIIINRQEDISVNEIVRREKNKAERKKKEELELVKESTFTEERNKITERLLKGIKMQHILKTRKSWNTKQNVILVRGLYGNICATYFSLLIANVLQKNNADVVYINDSHTDFLYTLENFSIEEKLGNHYVKNNIVFMEDFTSFPDVNFYIIDSKEAYYQNADILKENGFTPYYLVVADGDAKGLNYLKNERSLLTLNNIKDYRFIVRNIKDSLRARLLEEIEEEKIIEYKHLEDNPFSSLAENSRTSKEVYSIFSELDDRADSRIVIEQLDEENER